MSLSYHIKVAVPENDAAIEEIITATFGKERHKRRINILRHDCQPYAIGSYVAHGADGEILGSIRYYLAETESHDRFPFLGPLAVLPQLRGQGIGKALIKTSLQKLQDTEHSGVLIVGDTGYYAPFGFSPETVRDLDLGGAVAPLAFMGLEWQPETISKAHGKVQFIKEPNGS